MPIDLSVALDPASDTGLSNHDGITNASIATLNGEANGGNLVRVYLDANNNGVLDEGDQVYGSQQLATNQTDYQINVPLQPGNNSFIVTQSEPDALDYDSASITVVQDTAAPVAPFVVLLGNKESPLKSSVVADPTYVVLGREPDSKLLFSTDNDVYSTNKPIFATDGSADGLHSVYVEQQDVAGNTSASSEIKFTLDTTKPKVFVSSEGGTTTSSSQTISGLVKDANPGATVSLFNNGEAFGSATLDQDGKFATDVTLKQGSNQITVQDTDLAGNVGSSSAVTYTLSNSPPSVVTGGSSGTPPSSGITNQADDMLGTDNADTVSLLAGDDRYSGQAGNDVIYGNQGNDLLYGNQGDDRIFGGKDNDTAFGGQGTDTLFGNQGSDTIYGNIGADNLYGGQGNDTIYGGQGDDVLFGNKGSDVLAGGLGADTFGFNAGDTDFQSGVGTGDTISDFVSGTDKINFTQGPAAKASNFGAASTTSTDFASIQATAQGLINGGDAYAFVSDGVDGFLFTTGGTGSTIADAVKITGAGSVNALHATDIHGGAAA